MAYSDKDKQRAYQKNWIQSRRREWIDENGPCSCGSDIDLEVDHIDPSTKSMNPNAIWSRTESARLKELAKCQVLCKICHDLKTSREKATSHCSRGHEFSLDNTYLDTHGYRHCRTCYRVADRKRRLRSTTTTSSSVGQSIHTQN